MGNLVMPRTVKAGVELVLQLPNPYANNLCSKFGMRDLVQLELVKLDMKKQLQKETG